MKTKRAQLVESRYTTVPHEVEGPNNRMLHQCLTTRGWRTKQEDVAPVWVQLNTAQYEVQGMQKEYTQ